MTKIKYNKNTLNKFSLKELQKICTYYGIQFKLSWSKAKLVKEIMAYSTPELIRKTYDFEQGDFLVYDYPEFAPPVNRKSIRIQRIIDRKEK